MKLKPCPFCNGEAKFEVADWFCAECMECGATGKAVFRTEEKAITAWNTRADDKRIEELEAISEWKEGRAVYWENECINLGKQAKAAESVIADVHAELVCLYRWAKNWDSPFLDDPEWIETDGPRIKAIIKGSNEDG